MDWKNKIISLVASLIITAIVVNNTHGRISRNRYWKIELLMIVGFVTYWAFAAFMLFVFHVGLFYGIGVLGSFIFIYKYLQLQILRFHDLNYSGWYSLFGYVPILGLYFLYVRFAKKRNILLNEFDETIDYLTFFKRNRLYPKINLIYLDGMDFYINDIKFEYRKYNDYIQYEVSALSLEADKMLENYCKKNLRQTENAPSYSEKYKISFLDEGNLFEKLKKDLNAIILNKGFITVNNSEFFIRKNYGIYEIIYEKKNSDKIKSFSNVEEIDDYCCQEVNKAQLIEFINEIT